MILTKDIVAQELFGLTDASSFTPSQSKWATAALADTDRLVRHFMQRSMEHVARVEILNVGEPEHHSGLVPYFSVAQDRDVLYLSHTPVAVTGLTVKENRDREAFTDDHLLVLDTDYQIEDVVTISAAQYSTSGLLRRLNTNWPTAPGSVQVSYLGGPDATKDADLFSDLRLAEMLIFKESFDQRRKYSLRALSGEAGELTSETIGKYTARYETDADADRKRSGGPALMSIPADAVRYLEPHLSMRLFV